MLGPTGIYYSEYIPLLSGVIAFLVLVAVPPSLRRCTVICSRRFRGGILQLESLQEACSCSHTLSRPYQLDALPSCAG